MKKIIIKSIILTILTLALFFVVATNHSNASSESLEISSKVYANKQILFNNISSRDNIYTSLFAQSSEEEPEVEYGVGADLYYTLFISSDMDYTQLRGYIYNSSLQDATPGFNIVYNKTSSTSVSICITVPSTTPVGVYYIRMYYGEEFLVEKIFRVVGSGDSGQTVNVFSLTSLSATPDPIISGQGGTISFVINSTGTIDENKLGMLMVNYSGDVPNNSDYNVTLNIKNYKSIDGTIEVYPSAPAGYYEFVFFYDGVEQFRQKFTIHEQTVSVSSVVLNYTTLNLRPSDQTQLIATISPSNATDKTITWTSTNPSVASVDSDGNVTALSSGTTVIRASTSNSAVFATCLVGVTEPDLSLGTLTTNPSPLNNGVEGTITFDVSTTNINNDEKLTVKIKNVTTDSYVTEKFNISYFASGNTFEYTIKVPASIEAGLYKIEVSFGNYVTKEVTFPINNYFKVQSISLDKTNVTLKSNETVKLTPRIMPLNATNQNVTWSSSNSNIASVDSSGLVTAKSDGFATITVTTVDGNYTASCNITVDNSIPVSGVHLNISNSTLKRNETLRLVATINPINATNKSVTWSSSNSSVASVDSSGLVTAKSDGSATITVTTVDGNYTASCNITVISEQEELPTISSNTYEINNAEKTIIIPTGLNMEVIKQNISTNSNVKFYDKNNNTINSNSTLIGTGSSIRLDDKVSYKFIVVGDIDGNSLINIVDLARMKLHNLNLNNLSDVYFDAADVDRNGSVNIIDLARIKLMILGINLK